MVSSGGKKSKKAVAAISGNLGGLVRAGTTWWNVIESEEGKRLYIILHKFDHFPWRSFIQSAGGAIYSRQTFSWNASGKTWNAEDEKLRTVQAEEPIDSLEVPGEISWQSLCIGLDEVQDYEDSCTVTVRFDPVELKNVNMHVPTEEFLGADINDTEVTVYFRVYERGEPVVAFRGTLEGKCVPQLTQWEFKQNMECKHPLIAGYTPALILTMTKESSSQGMWSRVFKQSKHASELRAPTREKWDNRESPTVQANYTTQGPRVNQNAVCTKYHELMAGGLSSKEATKQAIAFVRKASAAGEPWAQESAGSKWNASFGDGNGE